MKEGLGLRSGGLVVDGHVHFHRCYEEETFFRAAWRNLGRGENGVPTLLLAEIGSGSVMERWGGGECAWSVERTEDRGAIVLGGRLLVVGGRQLCTAERIEVLALLCDEELNEGRGIDDTVDEIEKAGGISVLPWGAGKWMGERGRLAIQVAHEKVGFVGDNAGRPKGWRRPKVFDSCRVLPGSDPLGLRSEQCRVGSYGFKLDGNFDLRRPREAIRSTLKAISVSPMPVGERVGWLAFMRQQLLMRWVR